MTQAEAVDIIYLQLNGGKASADNNIKRDEIAVYFPTALGEAIKQNIFELKQMAMADKPNLLFESSIPEGYYSTVTKTPEYDSDRAVYKVQLPKVMSLPYGWAVRNPRAQKNPSADYVRYPNASFASGFESVFAGVFGYWTEEESNKTNLYLTRVSAPICPIIISIIKDPSQSDGGEKIDAPDDVIGVAIKKATEYFRNITPASRRHDDKGTLERET